MVILTDLGQRQKSARIAENTTYVPKTLQMPSLCFFFFFLYIYNLESQNAGLVDVKMIQIKKKKIKG